MAEQIDFDDWGETDLDTTEGARPRQNPANDPMKRLAYQSNRVMLRPDGPPIPQEVPAQFRQPQRPAPQPQPVQDDIIDQAFGLAPGQRSLEETFTEAERRFDKAKYYKLLLAQPIFSDSSVAGQEVEAEVRAFAQERFEVFLGMRQERGTAPIPTAFDGWEQADFDNLLQLIRTIRQKAGLLTAATKPAAPPAEPRITPRAPTTPTVAPEPALRPRAASGQPRTGENPPKAPRVTKGPRQRKLKPLVDPYTGQTKVDPVTGQPLMKDITPQVRPPVGVGEQPIPMQIGREAVAAIHATKASEAAANLEQRLSLAGEKGMIVRTAATYARNTSLGGHTEGEVVYEGADYRPDPTLMVAGDGEGGSGVTRN